MILTSVCKKIFFPIFTFSQLLISTSAFAQAPKTYTSSEILLQLKKLNTVGAVLYIAAHPDDENTRLISYLASEKCVRTGYLSLTRGDGGQNLIGPEQGIELGVIRTQELLAARRIDGGEQFFTRAYDFGFSKSPEETFTKWNRDSILSDMVWVIRNFRPDIIITRFATDGSGGHGHHTASAILAEEAFDAAADPTRFPEQLKEVGVWKTRRMFHNSTARFFNPNADLSHLIKLDVGGYNPLLGKSYGEIAAESRSMHKSQGFGSARQRGESFEYFKPIKGDTAGLRDIFEGIDFSWNRVKNGKNIGAAIQKTIIEYQTASPDQAIPNLDKVKDIIGKSQSKEYNTMYHYQLVKNIAAMCSGAYKESYQNQPTYAIGEKVTVYTTSIDQRISGTSGIIKKDSTVQSINAITELYWLKHPIQSNSFVIDNKYDLINNAGYPGAMEVNYKWVDPEKGELYRPGVITPPAIINIDEDALVFGNGVSQTINITLKAAKDSCSAAFRVNIPKGWSVQFKDSNIVNQSMDPAEKSCWITFKKKNEIRDIKLEIRPLTGGLVKNEVLKFDVTVDGVTYTKGIKEIKYDHIPVQTLFPEAQVKLVKLDVVKKSKKIGYIPGAGDEVQASLSQLGYEVITLTDDKLAKENLSQFDAIITGVRAYNTNDKLPSFKAKLMEYVNNGGNLIVQYNTNSWAGPLSSDIGPYKFKITRNRITDEEAKVNFLLPEHPVFNTPNKLTSTDFEGWIQERSIYHAGEWDSVNYVAPISMTDPYEMTVGNVSPKGKPDNGALIIGKYGKGNFIYTGIVFFRELPAGVPGAYRLMVNLIELGK